MAVLATKTEKLCKLCQHVRRADIDALLEKRANRETDEAGNRINAAYVLKTLGEWGVTNPTEENIKNHWKRHCQRVDSDIALAAQQEAAERVIAILQGDIQVDINADLDKLWAVGMAELEARISRGDRSGISPDLLMKIAAEKTRRQHNETQDELLRALTGGIAEALGSGKAKAVGRGEVVKELPETVEDAEYSEVSA